MKDILFIGLVITALLHLSSTSQHSLDDKNDLLQWYYNLNQKNYDLNLSREKRQGRTGNNFDYGDSSSNENEDEDDWYVFDEVEPRPRQLQEQQQPQFQSQPQFQPRPQSNENSNQFGWNPQPPQQSGSVEQGSFEQVRPNQPNQVQNPTPRPLSPDAVPSRPTLPNSGPPRPSRCVQDCVARTTSEYNPVCGSDGVTYTSLAKMNCSAACGISVQLQREGRCAPILPPPPSAL